MDISFSEESVKATWAAQAQEFADKHNAAAEAGYITACENWALNVVQSGVASTPPVNPKFLVAEITFSPMSATLVETGALVSDRTPESFLPKPKTGGVGGMVGKPLPGMPGCYQDASGKSPYDGQVTEVGGVRYTFRKYYFGIGGYWVGV